jgi:hypothetical protein
MKKYRIIKWFHPTMGWVFAAEVKCLGLWCACVPQGRGGHKWGTLEEAHDDIDIDSLSSQKPEVVFTQSI